MNFYDFTIFQCRSDKIHQFMRFSLQNAIRKIWLFISPWSITYFYHFFQKAIIWFDSDPNVFQTRSLLQILITDIHTFCIWLIYCNEVIVPHTLSNYIHIICFSRVFEWRQNDFILCIRELFTGQMAMIANEIHDKSLLFG